MRKMPETGFDQDQTSRVIGVLMGSMLGRKQNSDASESVQRDRRDRKQ